MMATRAQKTADKAAAKATTSPAKSKSKITKNKVASPISKRLPIIALVRMHKGGILSVKFDKATKEDFGDVYDWHLAKKILDGDADITVLNIAMVTIRVTPGTNDVIYGPPNDDGKTFELRQYIRSLDDDSNPIEAKRWGDKIAMAYKAFSKFNNQPPRVVIRDCRNVAVNHFLADEEVAKLVKNIYSGAIADGSFWEDEDLVREFFGDLEDPQDLFDDDEDDSVVN